MQVPAGYKAVVWIVDRLERLADRAWGAALLSLILPGLGQLMLATVARRAHLHGRARLLEARALAWALSMVLLQFVVVLNILAAIDAWLAARRLLSLVDGPPPGPGV